jgi:A/G-specific adenine glycosylase
MKSRSAAPSVSEPLPPPRLRAAFRGPLLRWFRQHQRDLPWRRARTPYRVWISELMLQQTRADQALPYYERFLRRFPTVKALAEAPRAEVLKLWEGLGYYARARRAHETARHLARDCGGRFPSTLEGLRALPGVGPYTAAAVGSLAFGLDAAVVDGNVIRVLARVWAHEGDVARPAERKRFQAWADALLPPGRAGQFNEAVMELGAMVCTPRRPSCATCPLRGVCRARAEGDPERYPVKARRAAVPHKHVGAGVVVDGRGRFLIAQRKDTSMLGGLWEFPGGTQEAGETIPQCIARELQEELGIGVEVGEHVVTVRHAFSHFTMDLHAHRCRLVRGRPRAIHCAAFRWEPLAGLRKHAYGKADLRIIEVLEKGGRQGARRGTVAATAGRGALR